MMLKYTISLGILVVTTHISCKKDDVLDKKESEIEIAGVWYGVSEIFRTDGKDDINMDYPPYMIAFAYDNGLELNLDGTLVGRCAERNADLKATSWSFCNDEYHGLWKRDGNQLILNEVEYEILSLSNEELIIKRQISSTSSSEITLSKQ